MIGSDMFTQHWKLIKLIKTENIKSGVDKRRNFERKLTDEKAKRDLIQQLVSEAATIINNLVIDQQEGYS